MTHFLCQLHGARSPSLWLSPYLKLRARTVLLLLSGALRATHLLSVLLGGEHSCSGLVRSSGFQITEYEMVFSNLTLLSSALFCNKSDLRHVDWVKSYLNIWSELQTYIKEHHTTGLTWSKTVSAGPSGGLSPERQKAIKTLVRTRGLIIISFRIYLKTG